MNKGTFKNYEILYEDHNSYLYAFVKGEMDSIETSIDYWTKVINKCKELGREKLLVVEKFENQVSVIDMFVLCEHIAELSYGYYLQIAFIDEEIDHTEVNNFGQTVATNRGVSVQIFESVKDAKVWLLRK